jgi:hypothetical protein
MGAMGRRGRLAQLVERLLYTQDVGGSSPSPPTRSASVRPARSGDDWGSDPLRKYWKPGWGLERVRMLLAASASLKFAVGPRDR